MKCTFTAFAATLCALSAGATHAQLRQPVAAQPISLNLAYYAQGDRVEQTQASPSDVVPEEPVPPVPGSEADMAPAAADDCSVCDEDGPIHLFHETCSGIQVGGWISAGTYYNTNGNTASNANNPIAFQDVFGPSLDQAWIYAEKALDTECGCDWGFRVDYLYGADSNNTDAFGDQSAFDFRWDSSPQYGSALPQAYVQYGCCDWNVKVGHFYTIIGYEVVGAPNNFFYTHAYTMNYGEPFTHTGVLFEKSACCDQVTLWGGWTNGWDAYYGNHLQASTFLGGASYAISDSQTLTWACTVGDYGDGTARNGVASNSGNIYMQSVVYDWQINECMEYVFQSDYGRNWDRTAGPTSAEWYGINQYFFYTLSSCYKAGLRLEWFDDADGARVLGSTGSTNYYSITAGLNYTPNANIIIRPEVRYDWANGSTPFNPNAAGVGTDADCMYYGADFILIY
ncbi:MAG: porin [Planctomycetales bacterium]|nr:porin [Planctomycetales bacterium]